MEKTSVISFVLDGKIRTIDLNNSEHTPTTTVLNYLRSLPTKKGVKEGCAEGDCGACSVAMATLVNGKLQYRAYDSCLIFLPMLQGKQLITVENVGGSNNMHPVQAAMVDCDGSQCGFCTPGFIMSLFAVYKNYKNPSRAVIDDALAGNLCRCTGYQSIINAAEKACSGNGIDQFTATESETIKQLQSISGKTIVIDNGIQTYYRPTNLAEASNLKNQFPDALLINGATDIGLLVTKRHMLLKSIIDLDGITDFSEIKIGEQSTLFGAGVKLEDVKLATIESHPALEKMLAVFGSKQIRNLATMGGNVGSASPIGDTPPVLMAYDATLVLTSTNGDREVQMRDFVTGYRKTVLANNEIIKAFKIPQAPAGTTIHSYKVSKREQLDISTVSGGFRLKLNGEIVEEIKLYYGGMAAQTIGAAKTEAFLLGKTWDRATVNEAMQLIAEDFTPITDARSTAAGRTVMAKNLLLKFWSETAVAVPA